MNIAKKRKKNIIIVIFIIISAILIIISIIKKNSKEIEVDSHIKENVEVEVSINEINEENQIISKNVKAIKKETSKKVAQAKVQQEKEVAPVKVQQVKEITYIKGILLVNKKYTLPSTYNPGVNSTAKSAFEEMKKGAAKDGISLKIVSSFRSYNTQKVIYNNNFKKHGERIANRFSAKAGQSEHQTGLAFDLNKANRTFVGTKEAKWLAKNCYKYGFIIRYPEGKESITGYVYEPWHVRYVGNEVAKEIYNRGICLEEYLGVN